VRERARLRVAIQKSGRLSDKSVALFTKCGLDFDLRKDRLLYECTDFPVDLMLVRDDDIPEYVADGVCDLGVVGQNVLLEAHVAVETVMPLGFGPCRLSIAVPQATEFPGPAWLDGKRIATSYPGCLQRFLDSHGVRATIIELSGSVEIAPSLAIADAVCDLVSSGSTLRSNGLVEVLTLFHSEAVLVRTPRPLHDDITRDLARLLQRMRGVLDAVNAKYIMMNAPRAALAEIRRVIPGMEEPSIMELGGPGSDKLAVHAVARETIFWETIERLKAIGATSILVLPIEKVIA
jgi:ATP phosphoribosyltransferase